MSHISDPLDLAPPHIAVLHSPIAQLAAVDPIAALAALHPAAAVVALSRVYDLFNPALNPAAALLLFAAFWPQALRVLAWARGLPVPTAAGPAAPGAGALPPLPGPPAAVAAGVLPPLPPAPVQGVPQVAALALAPVAGVAAPPVAGGL